jgi:hypothetical protein
VVAHQGRPSLLRSGVVLSHLCLLEECLPFQLQNGKTFCEHSNALHLPGKCFNVLVTHRTHVLEQQVAMNDCCTLPAPNTQFDYSVIHYSTLVIKNQLFDAVTAFVIG